jgi:hypothetical protein
MPGLLFPLLIGNGNVHGIHSILSSLRGSGGNIDNPYTISRIGTTPWKRDINRLAQFHDNLKLRK